MNSQYKTCAMRKKTSVKQHGVVLFIALIALVVLSLAAVALIRSVDTNTLIAGNLAFKQSATISADSGLETAITWLATPPPTATLNAGDAAQGYYATQTADPTTFAWNASDSLPATDVSGNIDASGTDKSGNTIRYIIQRMCRYAGPPTAGVVAGPTGGCLFGALVAGSSQGVKSAPGAGAITTTGDSPMYRVTARVTGPQKTVSYIQAFVY